MLYPNQQAIANKNPLIPSSLWKSQNTAGWNFSLEFPYCSSP